METFILVTSTKVRDMEPVLSSMEKWTGIQANGKMICNMGMVSLSQTMVLCMKVSSKEERNMVLVS